MPKPAIERKYREPASPRSTRRRTPSTARRTASLGFFSRPASRAQRFTVPLGMTETAVSDHARPFTVSLSVPSPPQTKTIGTRRSAALAAAVVASPAPEVSAHSAFQPCSRSHPSAADSAFRFAALCAVGLTMTTASLLSNGPVMSRAIVIAATAAHKPRLVSDGLVSVSSPLVSSEDRRMDNEKMGIKRLDHVCWAVERIDDALPLLTDLMGMTVEGRFENKEVGFRGVLFQFYVEEEPHEHPHADDQIAHSHQYDATE